MPGAEPRNPEFENAVRQSFARQSFMETLGASLELVKPGEVRIAYARKDGLSQQHGVLHAGVATSIVDSACGYAALSLAAAGAEVLTIEFKINFLKPAHADRFLAVGRVLRSGRTIAVCEGDVFEADGGESIARMQATMMIVPAGT